ncbi:MAG TPA: NAD(+)/NADH kinase [Candidatus Brocadiia bacterium]|nr:NAD(+)/NADH kinase [Planctomycetota bacterium]MDO8092864.1 NAD(+)/NADH kinase [Candidatus Brocadiales bacterium]
MSEANHLVTRYRTSKEKMTTLTDIKKVILLGNLKKRKISEAVKNLEPWLKKRTQVIIHDLANETETGVAEADIAIVLGGDGALLSACRRLGEHQIPIVGVHLGKFGFLTELTENDMYTATEKILDGECKVVPRMLLTCSVQRKQNIIKDSLGLNDAVISRPALSRLITLKLLINGDEVATYRTDGLIVSTPVGSTAHSLSAGGPILVPDIDAFIITPICPHTLTNRPIVVPGESRIEIEHLSEHGGVGVTIDGQVFIELMQGDRIKVEKSNVQLQLIDTGARTFYEVLREKLDWGELLKYGNN